MDSVWTTKRVEQLREWWADGFSAAWIAAELRCFGAFFDGGRSAVCGKIHRLKLPHPHGKVVQCQNKRQKREPLRRAPIRHGLLDGAPPLAPAPPKPRIGSWGTPLPRRNPSNGLAAIAIAGSEPGLSERHAWGSLKGEAPTGRGIQVRDLDESNCHWPKGDPKTPDFEFCGARAVDGKPYCRRHCQISYQPPYCRYRADKTLTE